MEIATANAESRNLSSSSSLSKKDVKKDNRKKGGGCYHCGSNGHRAKECPIVVCRICQEIGHDVRGCPQKQQTQSSHDDHFHKFLKCSPIIVMPPVGEPSPQTRRITIPDTSLHHHHHHQHQHFQMYKPPNVLCQFVYNAKKRKNRKLLGDFYNNFPSHAMAIGRLDEDSEGLLLLTTDGKLSERVRSKHVEKEYHCQVDGKMTFEAIERMKMGLEISVQGKKILTLPCQARNLSQDDNDDKTTSMLKPTNKIYPMSGVTSWVSIIVTEGKFRQVRKMTAAVGFPTLRLVRVRIANITLGSMQMGEVREIDIGDIVL